tara:strand:+ start:600 stop:815 length:216 start_codon:yes stop_codon:yes gene_type:complete
MIFYHGNSVIATTVMLSYLALFAGDDFDLFLTEIIIPIPIKILLDKRHLVIKIFFSTSFYDLMLADINIIS